MRRLIDFATVVLVWLARSRRLRGLSGARLNVGSGLRVAPGWINLDASMHSVVAHLPKPLTGLAYAFTGSRTSLDRPEYQKLLANNRFVLHDVRYGLPIEDSALDFVYCAHLLEVLSLPDAQRLINEMHRVLVPGGQVRLGLTDLEVAVEIYRAGSPRDAVDLVFGSGEWTAINERRRCYDFELISAELEAAGFSKITRRRTGEGDVPDAICLDRDLGYMLFVEATK